MRHKNRPRVFTRKNNFQGRMNETQEPSPCLQMRHKNRPRVFPVSSHGVHRLRRKKRRRSQDPVEYGRQHDAWRGHLHGKTWVWRAPTGGGRMVLTKSRNLSTIVERCSSRGEILASDSIEVTGDQSADSGLCGSRNYAFGHGNIGQVQADE
jgi:hypothetical protein